MPVVFNIESSRGRFYDLIPLAKNITAVCDDKMWTWMATWKVEIIHEIGSVQYSIISDKMRYLN